MELKGKRILVTGGTGLLGAATVKVLIQRGDVDVRVFARNEKKAKMFADDPVEIAMGDITDRSSVRRAVEGCDVVIHSVMATGDGDLRLVNVEGTRHVLDAALEQNVERLVHISSVAAYSSADEGVVDETAPREPDGSGTSYHDTKLESEELALQYWREKGLPVVVLQPVVVYGPRPDSWTTDVLERLRNNMVILVGDTGYDNRVYVDDVARGMIQASEQDGIEGETFIVSGKENILLKDFYGAHERMLGTRCMTVVTAVAFEAVDGDLEALARKLGLPEDKPFSQSGPSTFTTYSHEKANRAFGYAPEVSFAEGMARIEAWARAGGLPG